MSYPQIIKKLFGNCPDFIELIIDGNENAYKLIDFLMKNRENNGFISLVTAQTKISSAYNYDSIVTEGTHYVETVTFGVEMFIIFDEKNADLLGDGDKKIILDQIWKNRQKLTEEQENIVCPVLIFSQKAAQIGDFTVKEILRMLFSYPGISLSCRLKNSSGKILNFYFENLEHFEVLTDQIFEIHWIKKSLENETTQNFMGQLSKCFKQNALSKSLEEEKDKLMRDLEKITNVWNQKMKEGLDLLTGKPVAIYDLWSTFPLKEILEMKKHMQATDDGLSTPLSKSDPADFAL
uniref:Uncharacterized protein n=1 Tax=Panagrolaimus sp. JU765 TaxID=591449 RepID=A0AC34RQ75_9BILA